MNRLTESDRARLSVSGTQLRTTESRAFCPTGKGGGIDNSCSSKGGGGAVAAVGDTLKRSDVKVGQTISVQKHGQTTVHNGVVTSVKNEGPISEITLRNADGKETTVRIRDLAAIREANLGDKSPLREPSSGGKKQGEGRRPNNEPPQKPIGGSKKEREQFKQEVRDFCASHGVKIQETFAGTRNGANVDAMHEVAVGVSRLVNAGQEPPSVVIMTTRIGNEPMGRALGYYHPNRPDAVYVNARMPPGEPQSSINSGFLAGTGSSGSGTVIVHENAHRLHARAIGEREFSRFPRPEKRGGTTLSYRDHQTAGHVSRYGQTCEVEFVAETYSGHMSGRRYPDEVYQMYDRYGGPRLPGVRVTSGGKVKVKPVRKE